MSILHQICIWGCMYTPDDCQSNISEYYLISVYLHYIIPTVLTSDNLHPFGKYLKVAFSYTLTTLLLLSTDNQNRFISCNLVSGICVYLKGCGGEPFYPLFKGQYAALYCYVWHNNSPLSLCRNALSVCSQAEIRCSYSYDGT